LHQLVDLPSASSAISHDRQMESRSPRKTAEDKSRPGLHNSAACLPQTTNNKSREYAPLRHVTAVPPRLTRSPGEAAKTSAWALEVRRKAPIHQRQIRPVVSRHHRSLTHACKPARLAFAWA
jgi:hypothetical protein